MSQFVLPQRSSRSPEIPTPRPAPRAPISLIVGPKKPSAQPLVEYFPEREEKQVMSLTPGWICLGMGTLLCWFFVSGNAFFVGALVFGIVALAKGGRVWPCTGMIVGSIFLPIFCFGVAFQIAFAQAEKKAKIEQEKFARQLAPLTDNLTKSMKELERSLKAPSKTPVFPTRKSPNREQR